MGKWSPEVAGWHRPKLQAKTLRKVPKVAKRGGGTMPQRVKVTTSCNNDDKEVNGSEEYVTTTKRDFKHQVRQPSEHFEKLLEAAYPNHAYPIKHKLKECTIMKNFMTLVALSKAKKPDRDLRRGGGEGHDTLP
jgi:hypothetical protein